MAQAGRSGSFGNLRDAVWTTSVGPLEVARLEEGPCGLQVEVAVVLMLLEGDRQRLHGGGEVLRLEEGEAELAVDRRGLGSGLGGDLVVLEGAPQLPAEPHQVAEVLEEKRLGRGPRRLAETEPRPLGVASGVVDESESVEERGVFDPSLLRPGLDVLQDLAGLLGERLRVVAGELLEPLRETVGGEALAEALEPLARLAAEEEALRCLLALRLVGQRVPLGRSDLEQIVGFGQASLEVGGLLLEGVPFRRRGLELAAQPRLLHLEAGSVFLQA